MRSWFKLPPGFEDGVCNSFKNRMYPYVKMNRGDLPLTYTHNGCWCNELLALKFRHQMDTPKVDKDVQHHIDVALDSLFEHVMPNGEKLRRDYILKSRQQVVNQYSGRYRRRYAKAMTELKTLSLNHKDFMNKGFVKADKENTKDISKASRLIQYMKETGALEMGRFTHAVELDIYSLQDKYGTKIFGKGGNLHEIAEDMVRKKSNFLDPVYLLLDASKFDAHVSDLMLKSVAKWYPRLLQLPKQRKYVAWLWQHTITNYGFTAGGIRFKTHGTRMSGHMDTGLGNSLIMFAMITSYLKVVGITKYSMSVNGDDSVVMIERSDVVRARDISIFKRFGFNMKFEMTDDFSQMDYCQTRPVKTKYGWILARAPDRILGRVGWSVTKFSKAKRKDYLFSLGKGEQAINYGLPIGYALGKALVRAAPHGKMMDITRKRYISYTRQRYWASGEDAVIDDETRMSYYEAWGIAPEEQIAIERGLKISLNPRVTYGQQMEYDSVICSNLIF